MLPSVGGVGTLYYSVLNLRIDPEKIVLTVEVEECRRASCKFWYDQQWAAGFMPSGSPWRDVLRAAGLLEDKRALSWDWMEI